jgi:hypothetical protein
MPEIYVIRPTERAAREHSVPIAEAIVNAKCARGFYSSLARVRGCKQIIITDGVGYNRIAKIERVEDCHPLLEGQCPPRVTVYFYDVRELIELELNALNTITWSSRNVRYLNA